VPWRRAALQLISGANALFAIARNTAISGLLFCTFFDTCDEGWLRGGWPIGLPVCRPLTGGLWEVRSSLPSKREARVLFGFREGTLIALHAFIKKAAKTPPDELAIARQRMKELIA
jgi:hypothetical protein